MQRLKLNTIISMKKLLLAAVAVGSFSLFSFRSASEITVTRNAENPNLYDVKYTADTFTTSVETFPDKFVRARETWTKVDMKVITGSGFQASMNEIDEAIKSL